MPTIKLVMLMLMIGASSVTVFSQQVGLETANEKLRLRQYSAAAAEFESLTKQEQFKKDAAVWHKLAISYRNLGEMEKAVKAGKKAVNLEPLNTEYRLAYASLLANTDGLNAALAEVGRVLKREPENIEAIYLRGQILLLVPETDKADAEAERLLRMSETSAAGYVLKARVLDVKLIESVWKKGPDPGARTESLQKAVSLLQTGIEKCGPCPDKTNLEYVRDNHQRFIEYFSRETPLLPRTKTEGSTFKILRRPFASYRPTEDPMPGRNSQGTVRIAVLFRSHGKS